MRLPVTSHNACPVHSKYHVQILEAYVFDDLVHCSLKKRGIDRHHRDHSPKSKACRKGHGVFLCDPHIKKALWEHIAEAFQPCAVRHGRCDSYHTLLPVTEFSHDRRKNICVIGLPAGCQGNSVFQIKGRCAVEPGRMAHGRFIPSAFLRQHMDQYWTFHFPCLIEHLDHTAAVMAVDGSQIFDPHILKEHARNNELFDTVLCLVDPLHHGRPDPRHLVQSTFYLCLQSCVGSCSAQIAQVLGDTAHILRNGHFIIIEDNYKILF